MDDLISLKTTTFADNGVGRTGMTDMPTKKPQQAVDPMAFLNMANMDMANMARDYADAANELFMITDARPKIQGRGH